MQSHPSWNPEIINILNKIRLNSIILSNKHRMIGLQYQYYSRFFDLPIIVTSTISSSLGSISYIQDSDKQSIILFISIFITCLSSIKIYLNLSTNLITETSLSRDFYLLSIDIYKNLNLTTEDRPDSHTYLNESYSQYCKLIEQSSLYAKLKHDELLKIDKEDDMDTETILSYGSSSSLNSPTILRTEINEF